jgi:hypothetical protein
VQAPSTRSSRPLTALNGPRCVCVEGGGEVLYGSREDAGMSQSLNGLVVIDGDDVKLVNRA